MKETTLEQYKERMLRVLVHIQQHLDEELSLEGLAGVAAFSPYHFHRIFRGMLGEPVKEHIRRLRLERAAMRLKHSDMPVTMIAFEAGYETHEAFTRAFKAMGGLSPSEFRSRNGTHSRVAAPSRVHYQEDGALNDFSPVHPGGDEVDVTQRIVSGMLREPGAPAPSRFLIHSYPMHSNPLPGALRIRSSAFCGQG